MVETDFVDETFREILISLTLFLFGFFVQKINEWWKFITARAKFDHLFYARQSDILIPIDYAIPKFELDGQSIAQTDELFSLHSSPNVGLEEINAIHRNYGRSDHFNFTNDYVFGANNISSLANIVKIPDVAERIETSRLKVSRKFSRKLDGMIFNNGKFGLRSFKFDRVGADERSRLDIRAFATDYFTHCVMQDVITTYLSQNPNVANEVSRNKSLLNTQYYPFLTSIGLNVFVFTDLKRKLVFSRRSSAVSGAREFSGRLHVAMNEGMSVTDFEFQHRGDGQVTAVNCFRRGMREELGFNEYDNRMGDLNLYDTFLLKENFQFGMFGWCSFNGTFNELRSFRAQDKHMESIELVEVDFNRNSIVELLKSHDFIPYTRIGLENLCRIHGIEINKAETLSFSYLRSLSKAAFESIFRN